MLKCKILSIGKTRESWLEEGCREYVKRLQTSIQITYMWAKDDAQLEEWALREPFAIGLDPSGRSLTSEQFALFIEDSWKKGGSRLTFIIGGPDGLPSSLKNLPLISLSSLTFTHQMTRLILVEQLYRAWTIQSHLPYHR